MNKNWFVRHKVLTIVIIVVIFLLTFVIALIGDNTRRNAATNTKSSGSSSQQNVTKTYRFPDRPNRQPTDVEVAMNEPATVSGVKMTVNSVEYRSSMSGVEVASPGQTYVVVDVTIQNIGTQSQPFDAKNFKFQYGSTGAEYDMTYATMQNPLDYGDLAPGAMAEGQVTFLVATAPGHQYILWEPGKGLVKAVALIK